MEIDENVNNERLQRAIKCLQFIQRTNPPKARITKAVVRALGPLMDEAALRPLPPPRGKKAPAGGMPLSIPERVAIGAEPSDQIQKPAADLFKDREPGHGQQAQEAVR